MCWCVCRDVGLFYSEKWENTRKQLSPTRAGLCCQFLVPQSQVVLCWLPQQAKFHHSMLPWFVWDSWNAWEVHFELQDLFPWCHQADYGFVTCCACCDDEWCQNGEPRRATFESPVDGKSQVGRSQCLSLSATEHSRSSPRRRHACHHARSRLHKLWSKTLNIRNLLYLCWQCINRLK